MFRFPHWHRYPFHPSSVLTPFTLPLGLSKRFKNNQSSGSGRRNFSMAPSAKTIPKDLKLVVFDLDFTMWPYHVDCTVSLPFFTIDHTIFDRSGQEINPFPEATDVLEYLSSNGVPIAAASRTTKPPGAQQLIELLHWNDFFKFKEIYPGSKITHFKRFKDATNLPYSSMLFFDDEERNIQEISKLGVKCVFVRNGISMDLLHQAFELFENK